MLHYETFRFVACLALEGLRGARGDGRGPCLKSPGKKKNARDINKEANLRRWDEKGWRYLVCFD